MRKLLWNLCLLVASSFNYASVSLLLIVWNLDLLYYLPLVFIISCMIGALVVDIAKSIIYTYACMTIGHIIAIAIFLFPYLIFEESVQRTNVAVMAVLNSLVKVFLVSAIVYFFGAILGCFVGEKLLERIQT
jgi:hypothetical protein